MARRSNDIPDLVHILTVASSVEIAAGGTCTEAQVRERLAGGAVYEDLEGSAGVLKAKAREVRSELIADADAKLRHQIAGNAEIDRRKRQAQRESAEAGRRQRESQYFGPRVSAPGAAPAPWMPEEDE